MQRLRLCDNSVTARLSPSSPARGGAVSAPGQSGSSRRRSELMCPFTSPELNHSHTFHYLYYNINYNVNIKRLTIPRVSIYLKEKHCRLYGCLVSRSHVFNLSIYLIICLSLNFLSGLRFIKKKKNCNLVF